MVHLIRPREIVRGTSYRTGHIVEAKSSNLVAVQHRVPNDARWKSNKHKGGVLWFTGLPGSGKSTLATDLEQRLFDEGYQTYMLDGDNVRNGLNRDLGFSPEDRTENIRRIGEVAALFAEAGTVVVTAFISPYQADRHMARDAAGDAFHEVYIKADVATCESRDPKGHYKKARAGEIPEFTGISAPYETPENAELIVDTMSHSVEECVEQLASYVAKSFKL